MKASRINIDENCFDINRWLKQDYSYSFYLYHMVEFLLAKSRRISYKETEEIIDAE